MRNNVERCYNINHKNDYNRRSWTIVGIALSTSTMKLNQALATDHVAWTQLRMQDPILQFFALDLIYMIRPLSERQRTNSNLMHSSGQNSEVARNNTIGPAGRSVRDRGKNPSYLDSNQSNLLIKDESEGLWNWILHLKLGGWDSVGRNHVVRC